MLRQSSIEPEASVVRTLDADLNLHALHRQNPERYPFLLQSTANDTELGRFDILFASPGERIVLNSLGELDGTEKSEFLGALDAAWRDAGPTLSSFSLPFTGGWFLYLGYELAAEIEPRLRLDNDSVLPAAFAVRCKAAVVFDHSSETCLFVREPDATLEYAEVQDDIEACGHDNNSPTAARNGLPLIREETDQDFTRAVLAAKNHIAAGDIYQANLSRRWQWTDDTNLDADLIYHSLGNSNPAPFAGLVRWQDTTIISSSPERLLRIRGTDVSTRPIAGTRPRSEDKNADDVLSAELFAHPKEIAEHVMLIDLERNDLGRICEPGSVEVDEMMVLESYAHVHHIVSNVRGRLREDVSPGEAIRAVFPGGTITGCPKVRCMEIIQELEQSPRGAYTGSFGYLNRNGDLDLNILIRTMVAKGNTVTFRAGSGIVADSQPLAELAETRAKAKGMLRALQGD